MKFKVGNLIKLDEYYKLYFNKSVKVNGTIISINNDGLFACFINLNEVYYNSLFDETNYDPKLSSKDIRYLNKNYQCIAEIDEFLNKIFIYISAHNYKYLTKVITDLNIKCRKNV